MSKRNIIILATLSYAIGPSVSIAQENDFYYHRRSAQPYKNIYMAPMSTGNSGTGANIDVIYDRIQWTVDPNDASKTITGTITTYFKTIENNVSSLSFDLNKNSFNNASLVIAYHGIGCTTSFPTSGNVNIVNITLPSTIASANTIDSIIINYSGTPPAPAGSAYGYQRTSYTDASAVMQFYINTLSESYEDRDWWPCKADMQDKIDSMDIAVTIPWTGADTFWVASNGKLIDSTITGSNRTYQYKTRYPIASYLVCLTVAKFNRYYRSVQLGSTTIP